MNLLKSTQEYTIEVYPFGLLVCAADGKSGVPMDALKVASAALMVNIDEHAKAGIDAGIANALGGIFAIGANANLEKWRKQITEYLALGNTPKEYQWIRGVDCGMSSMALFRKLSCLPQAAGEARARLHGRESNDTPRDSDDFGRCVRMVEFCGFKDRLNEARGMSPEWNAILSEWDNLCVLYHENKHEEITRTIKTITSFAKKD